MLLIRWVLWSGGGSASLLTLVFAGPSPPFYPRFFSPTRTSLGADGAGAAPPHPVPHSNSPHFCVCSISWPWCWSTSSAPTCSSASTPTAICSWHCEWPGCVTGTLTRSGRVGQGRCLQPLFPAPCLCGQVPCK